MLAELQNVLPASAFMGQSQGLAAMRQIQVPAEDLARAGLFQELLSRGALAPTVVKPSRSRAARLSERVARWLIAFVIVFAVALPNGSNLVQSFFQLNDVNPAVYKPVADQIGTLQAGDRVLVAFDYDAFQAGEMDAVAQALMTHIRQRGADIVAVSLGPTGLALADRVATRLGLTGAPFIDRRYLPGQSAGAQDALIAAKTDPFDLIVVLAGSPDALRWWIEQATLSGAPPPIVVGVSAGVLPQAQLYAQSAQVKGIIAGMMGGLAYQRANDSEPDAGDDALGRSVRAEGLYLSQLAFAVTLILGAIVSLVAGTRRGT
jgi:hypothetical protein